MSRHRIASGHSKIVLLYWDFERNAYTCWRSLDALLKDSCCAMKVIQWCQLFPFFLSQYFWLKGGSHRTRFYIPQHCFSIVFQFKHALDRRVLPLCLKSTSSFDNQDIRSCSIQKICDLICANHYNPSCYLKHWSLCGFESLIGPLCGTPKSFLFPSSLHHRTEP